MSDTNSTQVQLSDSSQSQRSGRSRDRASSRSLGFGFSDGESQLSRFVRQVTGLDPALCKRGDVDQAGACNAHPCPGEITKFIFSYFHFFERHLFGCIFLPLIIKRIFQHLIHFLLVVPRSSFGGGSKSPSLDSSCKTAFFLFDCYSMHLE